MRERARGGVGMCMSSLHTLAVLLNIFSVTVNWIYFHVLAISSTLHHGLRDMVLEVYNVPHNSLTNLSLSYKL